MEKLDSSRAVILGENNWPAWKLQTSIVLKARKLYKVVVEVCSETDQAGKDKWDDLDRKAQEVIVLRVEEGVLNYLATCETAKEMWDKLNTIYDSKSKVGIHLIQQKFYNLKYEAPMAKYLSTVDEIVNKLKTMKEEISEKMVITKILMSLPDCFKHFISAWESVAAEERTLKNLQARLLVEEERSGASQVEGEATSAALLSKHSNAKAFKKGSSYNMGEGPFGAAWWSLKPRVRRELAILGAGMGVPRALHAGPFNRLDLPSFVQIVRTAYSYYAVLGQTSK